MSTRTQTAAKTATPSTFIPAPAFLVQRRCACGGSPGPTGECAECRKERLTSSASLPVQTKLTVGPPGDRYEQEADRVADAVMRMPEPRIQRQDEPDEDEVRTQPLAGPAGIRRQEEDKEPQGKTEEDEEEEKARTKPLAGQTPEVTPELEADIHRLRSGGGRPLEPEVRAFMEPRFGYDFSGVRLHTDGKSAAAARTLNARAFTVGQDVTFAANQYSPETTEGRRLLAHELAHVVQQRR